MPGSSGRYHALVATIVKTFKNNRILHFVEIGTYNGNGAVNVIKMLQLKGYTIRYTGFDLFEDMELIDLSMSNPAIEANKSKIIKAVHKEDVRKKIKEVCRHVILIQGNTKQTLKERFHCLVTADVVYVDGGHDYETVRSDWEAIKKYCRNGTLIIFDDVGMPGVSALMKEIGKNNFSNNRCSFQLGFDDRT